MKARLKLTTRGRYAVVAMIEIGRDGKKTPVPLSDIAETTNISLSYLEQLIAGLRRHGLVKSYRGPGGGYTLARPAQDIVVSEILKAAEDSTPAKRHGGDKRLGKSSPASLLWDYIGEILNDNLKQVSLSDVLEGRLKVSA
jgi:Rrf2 family iron-sulfur cluster assembly transcriptional regulator